MVDHVIELERVDLAAIKPGKTLPDVFLEASELRPVVGEDHLGIRLAAGSLFVSSGAIARRAHGPRYQRRDATGSGSSQSRAGARPSSDRMLRISDAGSQRPMFGTHVLGCRTPLVGLPRGIPVVTISVLAYCGSLREVADVMFCSAI